MINKKLTNVEQCKIFLGFQGLQINIPYFVPFPHNRVSHAPQNNKDLVNSQSPCIFVILHETHWSMFNTRNQKQNNGK